MRSPCINLEVHTGVRDAVEKKNSKPNISPKGLTTRCAMKYPLPKTTAVNTFPIRFSSVYKKIITNKKNDCSPQQPYIIDK